MSLLAILYQLVPESPILAAYNLDDRPDFVYHPPTIQSGKPRILASLDRKSGGSWLGVNQHGLLVGATPRRKYMSLPATRSRTKLCRELLRCSNARRSLDMAMTELETGQYEGVNFIIADFDNGWAVHGGSEIEAQPLNEGLSVIGNGDVDDPRDERVSMAQRLLTLQTLDSPVKFLAVASKVFARSPSPLGRPTMVRREPHVATVSSTLVALGKKPRDAIYQYADGAPDETRYEDYSPFLRDILSRGLRESRSKAKA
ncbi:MAG: NRDE family protein [Pirellulaceae bacterium]|nr:NRDE family protein [Planctomycetales bacterium]